MMNYEKLMNPSILSVPLSGIRKYFDIASEMRDCISLGIGEPDFITPLSIRRAAVESIEQGETHYTSNWGMTALRGMIARYMADRYNLAYDPADEILVTVGSSEAIDLALRVLLSPGDEVIVPDPTYVAYAPGVRFAGGVPVAAPTYEEDEFKMRAKHVRACMTEKTKALILPYPNNPTGAIMRREDLAEIAEAVRGTDMIVISDEIYAELTYGDTPHVSFAALPGMHERTLTFNGFSKAFAMTGWRIGYACGPADIIGQMCKIHQYLIMCAPTSGQVAALEALKANVENGYGDILEMKAEYDRRRRLMVDGMRGIGLSCFEPLGAFYVFPNIRISGLDCETFCERLLREQMVATVPGNAFGKSGEDHIRCCYATSYENIEKALERINAFIKSL